MAQALKLIDINRSYVPIDPNSFPESMHSTQAEDAPEGRIPVIPYDGYNFMPTAYGYMSYFGINSILNVDPLTELASPFDLLRVDDVFLVQTPDLRNIMVALCEDGIYTKYAATSGAWDKVVSLTVPDPGVHKNYTKCVIGNEVYIYRANELNIWVMRDNEAFVPTALTPSTNMNMAAQQGIFKAGGRLGIWDSANSIAWSDIDDKADFTPSLETGAGNTIFQQIVGKIVNVIQHSNGFVIYCTRAIVHVRRTADANFFWASEAIFNDNGISYLNEVAQGQPDTTHYAYTTFGIVIIKNGQYEYIIPEVFSYLKEKRQPIYLRVLEGRFLFIQFLNTGYLLGIPNFSFEGVPASTLTFKGASYTISHIEDNPCKAIRAAETQHEGAYLYNTYGYLVTTDAVTPGQVPIWEDHIASSIDLATLISWASSGSQESPGSVEYFSGVAFAQGSIAKIDGSGNEFFIPAIARSLPLVSGYAAQEHTEPNTKDFFAKQDMIWVYEARFDEQWKKAVKEKVHDAVIKPAVFSSALSGTSEKTTHTFGPFVDLSSFSEANKVYGIAEKSAWLQRSLTKVLYIDVVETVSYEPISEVMLNPFLSTFTPPLPASISVQDMNIQAVAGPPGTVYSSGTTSFFDPYLVDGSPFFYGGGGQCYPPGDVLNVGNSGSTLSFAWTSARPTSLPLPGSGSGQACISFSTTLTAAGISDAALNNLYSGISIPLAVGDPDFPDTYGNMVQTFAVTIRTVDIDTCVHKNLGFTQIDGHGHYTLLGNFIVDDAIPEDPDYVDACDDDPTKSHLGAIFNGVPVGDIPLGCEQQDPTILSYTFTYPDEIITFPASEFLMQDGSIEPIYPTFQGAFVYDLQYKKWGKCGQPHKLLLNYSPINSQAGDAPIPADIFNVNAGCLLEDGTIAIFDKYPADSIIKWGKIGYFRKGFTNCEEVRIQFRNSATGTVYVEGSLDGKNIEPAITQIRSFENVNQVLEGFSNSARWFNICITGIYDVKDLDFNGHKQGKR